MWLSFSATVGHAAFLVKGRPSTGSGRPERAKRVEGRDVLFFLPGAESIYGRAVQLKNDGRYTEAIEELEQIVKAYPDILTFQGKLGYYYAQIGDWTNVYRFLKPIVEQGMMDATSLVTYGQAAFHLGKLDEADQVLRGALRRYPGHEHLIRVDLGSVCYSQALQYASDNLAEPAERLLAEADEFLNFTSHASEGEIEVLRRKKLALVTGLKADISASRGEHGRAVRLFREAVRLAPDLPGADGWQRRADELTAAPAQAN